MDREVVRAPGWFFVKGFSDDTRVLVYLIEPRMNVVPVLAAQRCLMFTHTVVEQIFSGTSCSALVVHLEASNFNTRMQ